MQTSQNRRRFLATLTATGTAGLIGLRQSRAQDGRPETTTVRLAKIPGICIAPQYVAEDLLRAEGFTDIRYVATTPGTPAALSGLGDEARQAKWAAKGHSRRRAQARSHSAPHVDRRNRV